MSVDLPNDEFMEIGESPLPGITLRHILRGHKDFITRMAWSPDGHYLASPSRDKTIHLWDISTGKVCVKLSGHKHTVYTVAWSPTQKVIASGSWDDTVRLWEFAAPDAHQTHTAIVSSVNSVAWSPDGKLLAIGSEDPYIHLWDFQTGLSTKLLPHLGYMGNTNNLAWAPHGQLLASASGNNRIRIWYTASKKAAYDLIGHTNWVFDIAWTADGERIFSCSWDGTIKLWNVRTGKLLTTLEGHTGIVQSCSLSHDGLILASKSHDDTVQLWDSTQGVRIAQLREWSSKRNSASLAFHPTLPLLATLGERDTVIRIWDVDTKKLLEHSTGATKSVQYMTAKLVLVGDSGVGKTALGWRMAHGTYKKQDSTHGQQFWVIDQLSEQREDGTQCEAVLWDLAGQHVYRSIHALYLDNVDASLIVFDPSNRQDFLKGVLFWLEQLKGKSHPPPSVLVGARVDRGAATASQQELEQFCQRYNISGGYIETSAKTGLGIPQLLEMLKEQIRWDQMTTTVTTLTFKRIKDYVLALKEHPRDNNILIRSTELQQQLQRDDRSWRFNYDEMITAVRHLQTHGYVTIVQSSAGEVYILLKPELLVNLAASVMLQADKHPHELGSLNEHELLQGRYPLDELKALDTAEQQILLDTAVLRFLERNICFRETLEYDTLLIFPSLIKQKRPLQSDIPAIDDISYIIRGRVENIYPMLVVLLGHTPSFTRINQWQNQAQYEMGEGEICGFRMIEEHEGEIELILYYGDQMSSHGRELFQQLFEQFLYQRDVEIMRFPPVFCLQGHRLERPIVIKRIREGKTFAFCDECGHKIDLPIIEDHGTGASVPLWLQREEGAARLRSTYESQLLRIKSYRRSWAAPRCYFSYVREDQAFIEKLINDLQDAGIYVVNHIEQVEAEDYVILVDTAAYQRRWGTDSPSFAAEKRLIQSRLMAHKRRLIPIMIEGEPDYTAGDFRDQTYYPVNLFDLVLTIFSIPLSHAGFEPLRKGLSQQWAAIPKEAASGSKQATHTASSSTAPREAIVERYLDFELHIAPDGRVIARSQEGEATAQISPQPPNDIQLALKLIEQRQTNTELLKQVGQSLYNWLFPSEIHTHFHQTEAIARQEKAKLRIRLRIDAASIARLPLEFLYRASGNYFLAANPDTVLSHYLSLPLPADRAGDPEKPLHILAIIAAPADRGHLDPNEWETIIKSTLAQQLDQGRVSLQTVKCATRKEIRKALLQQKPDIVQFVGHGFYHDGKGYIALVDDATSETWRVDEEGFASIFMGYDDQLRLVSMATCESARSDDPSSFVGIAPRLVQRGIPAVMAMRYEVYVSTAKIFLEEFYAAIAAHKPLDWAVQSARNAVALESGLDNREFATPVLYMRAKDGGVF